MGDFKASWEVFGPLLAEFHVELLPQIETIVAEAEFICVRARGKDCSTLKDRTRQFYGPDRWDEQRYQARKLSLKPA